MGRSRLRSGRHECSAERGLALPVGALLESSFSLYPVSPPGPAALPRTLSPVPPRASWSVRAVTGGPGEGGREGARQSGEAAALAQPAQPAQPVLPSPGLPARCCRASPPGAAALTGVHLAGSLKGHRPRAAPWPLPSASEGTRCPLRLHPASCSLK